mmetsp:Transcript_1419/g.3059  ORF Transcript_1419/g.3059 Transcript_1419/m.3059 type:complete len:174 (-) Transcript_1419:200-721(-)|eukprot:CAMPEP_0194325066 /NCGR_PEP_ID=MMETSP0171-20130528/29018_1 /TAXON_ID=218684 /ORGANISM="Corethron pennatum, Strain L29A3" /LENGTH=173 /DNA_ID=CAMNT_0039084085 /DNA_START=20 /DNA_END=541 /DNA_ORIENTATION=+
MKISASRCCLLVATMLCCIRVNAFVPNANRNAASSTVVSVPPGIGGRQQHRPRPSPSTTSLFAGSEKEGSSAFDEAIDALFQSPLPFVVPALFVGQIVFLATAKQVSGLDNLTVYGELGNAYIRRNGGYDQSKSFFERQAITSSGQKIWVENVLRDLQNGGPVTPPIDEPGGK